MARKNLVTGCLWLCLFSFFFSMKFSHSEQVGDWPTMIFTLGIVLSALLIVGSVIQLRRAGGSAAASMPGEAMRKVALSGGLIFLWILLFSRVGYLATTVAAMFLFMTLNNPERTRRNLLRDIAAAVLFPLFMFFVFSALGVRFPRGILI